MTHRGTTNRNARGGSDDRRARRVWLIVTFGDGVTAPCAFLCGRRVTVDTVTVDRYPLAGWQGGTYARENIRPACAICNYARRRVPPPGVLTSCHPDWWRLDWWHDHEPLKPAIPLAYPCHLDQSGRHGLPPVHA